VRTNALWTLSGSLLTIRARSAGEAYVQYSEFKFALLLALNRSEARQHNLHCYLLLCLIESPQDQRPRLCATYPVSALGGSFMLLLTFSLPELARRALTSISLQLPIDGTRATLPANLRALAQTPRFPF